MTHKQCSLNRCPLKQNESRTIQRARRPSAFSANIIPAVCVFVSSIGADFSSTFLTDVYAPLHPENAQKTLPSELGRAARAANACGAGREAARWLRRKRWEKSATPFTAGCISALEGWVGGREGIGVEAML